MKKLILGIILSLLVVSNAFANWKFNPFTSKQDFYESTSNLTSANITNLTWTKIDNIPSNTTSDQSGNTTSNITALYFIGNGSLLTGIVASGSNVSQDGAVAQNYFPIWNATGIIKNSTYSITDAGNWNLAFGWGNHSLAGYLKYIQFYNTSVALGNSSLLNLIPGAGITLTAVNTSFGTNYTIASSITQYTDALALAAGFPTYNTSYANISKNVSQDGAVALGYFASWNATNKIMNSTYSTTDATNWTTAFNNFQNKSTAINTSSTWTGGALLGTGLAPTLANYYITATNISNYTLSALNHANYSLTALQLANYTITGIHLANYTVDAVNLVNTSVTAGTYSTANITVDAQGRITAAASGVGAAGGVTSYHGSFTRDLTAASGNVAYTGVGFRPSTVFFFGATTGTSLASWGFTVGTSSGVIFDDNGALGNTYQVQNNLAIYPGVNGTALQYAAVNSLDADGFNLSWTKVGSPTGTFTVHYLAIK